MPDLATFAVDDGFSYAIPDDMEVTVGSIVRVPLGGRRVRGWVTAIRPGKTEGLKAIIGVSGRHPIVTADLLQTLRWAAVHYVAPLAALIPKAGPPNLPIVGRVKLDAPPESGHPSGRLAEIVAALSRGERPPITFLAGSGPWPMAVGALAEATVATGKSVMVVVPTSTECAAMAAALSPSFGNRVVSTTSAAPSKERTLAWSQARSTNGTVVVGTPEVALWPIGDLGLAIIIEEGRRAMKARQTPTLSVRDVLRRRAGVERFGLVVLGQVPTLETVAAGAVVVGSGGRAWPLVEIIDRNAEPPTSNPIAAATSQAIGGAIGRKEPVFVFVSRRGYSPALRCTSCGELRRCPQCQSNPGLGAVCDRCGFVNSPCSQCGGGAFAPVGAAVGGVVEELRRTFRDEVGQAGAGNRVQVGTERDIPAAGSVGLAVIVDGDSMLLRPHYRAEEDTLRILARVATTVHRGRGQRCVVQTRIPANRVFQALRHGSGDAIVTEWLAERESEQLPPFGELVAIELTGSAPQTDGELRGALGNAVAVFGPATTGDRNRWLIQAPDLRRAKIQLRTLAQSWRDRGVRVRIDADPLDV